MRAWIRTGITFVKLNQDFIDLGVKIYDHISMILVVWIIAHPGSNIPNNTYTLGINCN